MSIFSSIGNFISGAASSIGRALGIGGNQSASAGMSFPVNGNIGGAYTYGSPGYYATNQSYNTSTGANSPGSIQTGGSYSANPATTGYSQVNSTPSSFSSGTKTTGNTGPVYGPYYGGSSYSSNIGGTSSPVSITSAPVSKTISLAGIQQGAGVGTSTGLTPSAPGTTNYLGTAISGNIANGADTTTGMFNQPVSSTTGTSVGKGQQNGTQTSPVDPSKKALDEYLASQKQPTNEADLYKQAQREAGLGQAQEYKNNLQNQVNAVTAKMNTDLMNLRATGAKEGVTEAVYGGQQQEITREGAITLLPLQAQLSIAQGNLEQAQSNTNTLFSLYTKDAQRSTDFFNNQAKAVYEFATAKEKQKLDELKDQKNFDQQILFNKISTQNSLANDLLKSGNIAGYNAVTSIRPPTNVNSPTYQQDYRNYENSINSTVAKYSQGTGIVNTSPEAKVLTNAFNSAATGLTAGQLAQSKATFNSLVNNNDLKGAKEYLARVAVSSAPTADQTQIIGRLQAVDALTEVKSLLNQAKAKGASTNIVSGNLANIASKLGANQNPDLNYIGNRITSILQTYRRSMTGVAFSPSESKQYEKIFPDITDTGSLNTTKINALIDSLDSNNRSAMSFYIGPSNYDSIFGANSAKLPSNETQSPASQFQISGLRVTTPQGVFSFPSKQALEQFKKDNGLQ